MFWVHIKLSELIKFNRLAELICQGMFNSAYGFVINKHV